MESDEVGEHHSAQLLNYMRFAKFQRGQCLKTVKASIQDVQETRLLDDTFTVEEVGDVVAAVGEAVNSEVEAEMLNTAHTNVLLLKQLFIQAEKWHLNLDTDLSELENRELLQAVRNWEESELSENKPEKQLKEKKRLAPLNEGGPAQLLNLQIAKLNEENQNLRQRLKQVEVQTSGILTEKSALRDELEKTKVELEKEAQKPVETNMVDAAEIDELMKTKTMEMEELSQTVESVNQELLTEKELSEKSQKELEAHLASSKHRFLEVQHQLNLAEKELEKKFSQTGAYKNLKKMLSTKNDQIKTLRKTLETYEPNTENLEEEE